MTFMPPGEHLDGTAAECAHLHLLLACFRASPRSGGAKTCPQGTARATEPTASRKASAQVAQVFATHSAMRAACFQWAAVTISMSTVAAAMAFAASAAGMITREYAPSAASLFS